MAAVHGLVLYVALVPGTNLTRPTCALLGLLWLGLGLILPRVRRNAFLGVRTAWTLTSDENWARPHRVGGYAMSLGGLAGLLAVALVPGARGATLALATFVGSVLVPVVLPRSARASTGSFRSPAQADRRASSYGSSSRRISPIPSCARRRSRSSPPSSEANASTTYPPSLPPSSGRPCRATSSRG